MKKLAIAIRDGRADGKIEDAGALGCSLFFMRLHLYAVNGRRVPAKHRALYLWVSMIWSTSTSGICITPKRNLVSETISNVFLILRADVYKIRFTSSEPAEHGFGNMRRIDREFSCSDFVTLAEKEICRMNQMFKGKLKATRDKGSGYFETHQDYIQHAMINHSELEGGPCEIDLSGDADPVSHQLWPFVMKIINEGSRMMTSLLKLAEVTEAGMSPFSVNFASIQELLVTYVEYCPKTFSYKTLSGNGEADVVDKAEGSDVDTNARSHEQAIVEGIQQLAEEIKEIEDEDLSGPDDPEDIVCVVLDNGSATTSNPGVTVEHVDMPPTNSDKLMRSLMALMACSDTHEMFDLALGASAAIESVDWKAEIGSLSKERKAKSLAGRWIDGKSGKKNTDVVDSLKAGEFWIERHTIVTSNIKVGRARDTPMKPCTYRVLAVFDKLANKWFVTGEKKVWSCSTKEEDKK